MGTLLLKLKTGDNYIQLHTGNIIEVINIATDCKTNQTVIIGYEFKTKTEFYTKPCNSSLIGIYSIKDKEKTLNTWPVQSIKYKLMVLPRDEECVAIPILHTYLD